MKKNILLIAGFVLAFTAVSCSLEENAEPVVDSVVPMEFSADAPATRTAITDGNAVIWSEDDAISVFDGAGNHKFTAGTAGSTTTKFSGEAESGKETYYALYPYSADASLAGTTIHSVLPANQYSTADGTFDTMLAPAVAKAEENGNLIFHNVAGLVKFTFTGAGDRAVKSISMTAADQSLTGSYSVDMSGEAFSAVATGSASAGETPAVSGITLTAKEGNLAAGPYYLVALPGTYTNVEISVVFDDNTYMTGSVSSLTINAGKIKPTTIDLTEVQPTLYDKFMAGEDIVIAGKTYNKSQFEDATPDDGKEDNIKLVTNTNSSIYNTSSLLGDGKIIFVDIENQTTPLQIGNAGNIIVVGNDPENKALVTRSAANLQKGSNSVGRLVLANLIVDLPNSSTTAAAFIANSAFDELSFDNCEILMNASNPLISIPSNSIAEINIMNSDINIPAGSSNRYIITSGNNEHIISQLKFENNIFHTDDGLSTSFRIMNSSNSTETKSYIGNIVIQNNTFVNTCYNNSAAVIALNITDATITKNILYINQSMADVNQAYHCMLRAYGSYPATANCVDNIAYYDRSLPNGLTKATRYYFRIFQDNSYVPSSGSAEEFDLLDTDPFEGGDLATFTPAPAYTEYGAQR